MTPTDQQLVIITDRRMVLPALSLILVSVLSACSDFEDIGAEQTPSDNTAPALTLRPSQSAVHLADNSTVTVQGALSATENNESTSGNTLEPDTGAAIPDAGLIDSKLDSVDTDNSFQASVPGGAGSDDSGDSAASTQSSSSQISEKADQLQTGSTSQNTISTDSDENSVQNSKSEGETKETHFESVTTPGFEGDVLEDSIRIVWPVDPEARGYNVYRQADYYTTVFDTEFIDTDVYDDDYYYEIQAFDHDDRFSYIATGLTVSARSFGKTDPDAPKPKAGLLDDYQLVFADEFKSTSLDTSKWNTSFLWGADLFINGEEQYYVDVVKDPDFGFNPFTFDGEHLTINTIKTPDALSAKAQNQPYLSGIITSYDAFKFTYGYVETRAKMTHGRGYWPAFWLLNAYYVDAKPEIDIMEFIGHNQDVMYHTYHYFDAEGELRSTESFPIPGIDYTSDFHTFGVEWKPGTLIFYVDGIETYRIIDANVSQQEMYILANQAVGGWWAGSPDETTPLPGKYVVDYIRVYQPNTPYEVIEFDQSTDLIPLFSDSPGKVLPNHRPPFWLWPEGYPDGVK